MACGSRQTRLSGKSPTRKERDRLNKVIASGRVTKDTEAKYTAGDKPMCIASYTIACQRKYPHQDEADYIKCKAFGKNGEFADKYFKKGVKVNIVGSYHTGSYTNSRGEKVYTTEVLIEEQEFAESKSSAQQYQQSQGQAQQNPQYNSGPINSAPQQTQQYAPRQQAVPQPAQQAHQNYQQTNMMDQGSFYQSPNGQPPYNPMMPNNGNGAELDGFMNIPDGIGEDLPFA